MTHRFTQEIMGQWLNALPRPGSPAAIRAAVELVVGCSVASLTEDSKRVAVDVEIEGPTMAAAREAAALAQIQIPAGIAFSWIPAGDAARELEREAQGAAPDWRPADLMPEDFYAR